jgi:hypothetical protein
MASILLRFFSISGWKAQYAIAQGSSLLLTYDYGQFEININFLFGNFCLIWCFRSRRFRDALWTGFGNED